jgi:hypothetical protein
MTEPGDNKIAGSEERKRVAAGSGCVTGKTCKRSRTEPPSPTSIWLRREHEKFEKLDDREQQLSKEKFCLMKDLISLQRPGAQAQRKDKEDRLMEIMQILRRGFEHEKSRLAQKIRKLSATFQLNVNLDFSDATVPASKNRHIFAPSSPRIRKALQPGEFWIHAAQQVGPKPDDKLNASCPEQLAPFSMHRAWTELMWTDEILEKTIRRRSPSLEEKCSICLEYLVMNSAVSELCCGHHYHTQCLLQLLTSRVSSTTSVGKVGCPMCRKPLVAREDRQAAPQRTRARLVRQNTRGIADSDWNGRTAFGFDQSFVDTFGDDVDDLHQALTIPSPHPLPSPRPRLVAWTSPMSRVGLSPIRLLDDGTRAGGTVLR